MADLQISQLPQLAEADLAAGDELAIVDDSASETKRITAKALVEKGVALIDAGSIPGSALAALGANTVVTASITDANVTADKIANGTITATQIANATITGAKLVNGTVTATQIAANAITASELADDAVDTSAILDSAVTNQKIANGTIAYAKLNLSNGDIAGAKIANNSLTAGQIAANAIGASELADDAVDTNAIANVAVTGSKIATNAITNIKITDATITGAKLVNDTITATQIAANAITASELADDAVDTNAILDDAVTAAKLAAGAVDTTALGAAAVTGAKIAGTTITAANIVAGTITATELAANSVGASEIAANAVGASELADDAVDTAAIVNSAVTNEKIADATITYAKLNLSDGDIPSAKIAAGAIGTSQIAANAVGATELANDAVDTDAIQNLAVTGAKIAATTITGAKIAATTIEAGNIAANTITASEIAANAIGASELADNAVDTAAIVNAAVTNDKIANTTIAYAKLNLSNGDIAGAKIADNSLTAQQIAANAIGASELADNAVDTNALADDAVTGAKIAAATITGANIVTGTITATQLAADSVGASEIAANAVGASELADDAVDTAAILDLAVTGAKIAASTITAAKLNLSAGDIDGTKIANDSLTANQIAANAITASELANDAVDTAAIANNAVTASKIAANAVTATELADNAVDTNAIADGAVTASKLSGTLGSGTISDDAVTTSKIVDDAVTSAKLATNAVDATALANNAVDSGAIATGAVVEAKIGTGAVTDAKVASGISGAKLTDGTVTVAKLLTSDIDRSLNVAAGKLGINNTVSAGSRSGISYNAQGLITATTALVAGDLPVATTSAVGGVSVGAGLSVTGAGALSLATSVTGATVSGITFNNTGQITAATALVAGDLPVATTSAKGAVQITSGGGLTVDGSGNLITSTSGVSAGTYQSVTVNTKGVVTGGAGLTESLIPSLPASKITSGSLDAARIGVNTIDGTKLSNTSTTIFQSIAQAGYPTAQFSGQLLFDTVSEDAFIWDGTAWQAITTLTKGSLVFGGTYNASTSQMVAVTSAGAAAGLTANANLPSPSQTTDGVYVVISVGNTAGNYPSSPAPQQDFSPPDYILGVSSSGSNSWQEIDLSATVAGQVASNITFQQFGSISGQNVQDAIEELDTEKLPKANGTVTGTFSVAGQAYIKHTGSLVFEGTTDDAFETTLTVADPTTSDKTITLPNVTGTVITTGDTNTVTSTMVDASLVNANLAANASIAFSKLAALTSAQIIVGNGSNVPTAVAVTGDIGIDNAGLTSITAGVIVDADISGSAAITGSKIATGTTSAVGVLQLTDAADSTSATTAATPAAVKIAKDAADAAATTANAALARTGGVLTGHLTLDDEKELRFREEDAGGDHYIALKAAASLAADVTLTLPATAPTANQVLKANASTPTTLEWATDTTNTAAADLTGTTLASGVTASSLTSVGTLTGLTSSGDINLNAQADLRFKDADSSHYVALQSPASVASSFTLTLPSADAAVSGYVLASDGSGTLSWVDPGSSSSPTFTGDATLTNDGALVGFSNLNATYTGNTKTLTVTVASKTAAHRYYGSGSSSGYKIGGKESPFLTLTPGRTYKFDQADNSNSGHPLRFYLEADKTTAYTTGVTTSGTAGSAGAYTQIVVSDTTPQILHYQCSAHASMGNSVQTNSNIAAVAAAGTLSGATLASGVTASSLTSVGTLTGLTVDGDVTIADKIIHNGDTDTAIRFPAVDTFAIETGGSERVRIDSTGRLLLNTSSPVTTDGGASIPSIQVATPNGGNLILARNDTTVSAGENLGAIRWYGNDANGTYELAAQIEAEADLTHDTGDKPSRLCFSTTKDGSASPTERFRIDSAGRCIIGGGLNNGFTATTSNLVVNGDLDAGTNTGVVSIFWTGSASAADTELAQLRFGAQNNSSGNAQIRVKSDAAWGSGDYPTAMLFETTPDGSDIMTTALTIDSSQDATFTGNILMSGTGVIDIPAGTTAQRPGSADTGMFRYNTTLSQFEGYSSTGWGAIGGGGGATGGGTDEIFIENEQTATTSYTLSTNENAVTVGDLTVNNGVTITIPNNAIWVVL